MSKTVRRTIFIIIVILLVCADQVTKGIAVRELSGARPMHLLGGFVYLTYAENPGVFLGLGAEMDLTARLVIYAMALLAVIVFVVVLSMYGRKLGVLRTTGFVLFLAGALGNLVDRFGNHGNVIDFVMLSIGPAHTGIFNLADVFITVAVALILLGTLRRTAAAGTSDSPSGESNSIQEGLPLKGDVCIDGTSVLLLIDLQQAIDDPSWGTRNNPEAEQNVARLLSIWRGHRWPVVHVRHVSREPQSTYRDGQHGVEFKDVAKPLPGEPVVTKHVCTAFIGTDLESRLRQMGVRTVVIAGVITNNSVESTARASGDLGFRTVVVADATFTFGRSDFNGQFHPADEVHAMSLANLDGEYATILNTEEVLRSV
jgi:lipoprotein signal peptidase